MTLTETSLYQYHIQEWESFAREQYDLQVEDGTWDEGEAPEFDEYYIKDLAESYWGDFERLEDTERTWQNVDYSAGVYLGEISDTSITDRVILHDQTFYNVDGEYKPEVDMIEVTLMNSNPDLYGDECEEFVGTVIKELAQQKMLQILVDLNGKESLGKYITSEMVSRRPELVEVLLEWNQGLTYEQVMDSMDDANNGGIVAFFENRGIDF